MPAIETVTALQRAAEGITYPSETDSPWTVFAWPDASGEPTVAEVRKRGKHKPDSPVEEQTIEELFRPLIADQDWFGDEEKADASKNRALLAMIKQQLSGPKVFRIGERKLAVYIVGRAKEGGWAGLKTIAVET